MDLFGSSRHSVITAFVLALACSLFSSGSCSFTGFPVVLVPGDGGSQIEAKLNKTSKVHYFCDKTSAGYFTLWLNLELLLPYILDCWVDNMRLVYDNKTRTTSNSPGVDIRIPGFGNTSTIEFLDPSSISLTAYFKAVVVTLVTEGLERGMSVRGAPYDFRKGPNEQQQYFNQVKTLIEDTYTKNNKTRVVIIAHSMGSPFMLYFFNHQSPEWKDKYIRAFVTLAGVWGGAVKAMRVFASGDNLGVTALSAYKLRAEQRTSPSLAFLLPSDRFWSKKEILISTPVKNYTVADYGTFFRDLNFMDGYQMWKDNKDLIYDMEAPGVEVHCLHGANVSTDAGAIYEGTSFPDSEPKIIYGDGDGTVNFRSLVGCVNWQGKQKQKVYHKVFPGVDHMGILVKPEVLNYIRSLVTNKPLTTLP